MSASIPDKSIWLLVNYGGSRGPRASFPLGLAYISSTLKSDPRLTVHCLDLVPIPEEEHTAAISKTLEESGAGVVGWGGFSDYYLTFKTFSRHIRDVAPGVVIVVGGAIVTADPVYICKQLNLDYGVVGEGEETVLELASLLLEGGDPEAITGLVFRRADGTIVSNPARVPSLDIDDIPWPDWEGFNLRRHLNPDNPESWRVPILCSRSCPFKCTFCAHAISNYRMRKFDNVFKEMEYLVEHYDAKGLDLLDDMFSVKRERVSEFCQRITPLKLYWEAQVRVGVAESGLLKEMFEAGCRTVSYGFESYDLGVLRSMRKKIAPSQIDKACKLTYDNKISIQGNFIFSDVAETADSVNQTINWWARNRRYCVNLSPLTLFPGTELYRLALAQGKIAQEDSFYTNLVNPKLINLSSIPDPDYAILCKEITLSSDILSLVAPIKNVRLSEDRQGLALELICPNCGMVSSIPKWRLRNIGRCPCPFCRARFWASVTRAAPGLFPKEHTDLLLSA